MTNFFIYLFGTLLVAAALGYAAYAIGLQQTWIIVIVLVVIGFGIMGGVQKTSKRENPD